MASTPRDDELVARAQRGDGGAFVALYQKYYGVIYRYLRSRLNEAEVAEDLTSEVFLRAFESLGSYRSRGWPFSAFLYRVAKNLLVDHFRHQPKETSLDEVNAARAESADRSLEEAEMRRALQRGLAALPHEYQEVIRLRVLLGLPTATVAAWLGRSEGATRVLLCRAMEKLRRMLKQVGE